MCRPTYSATESHPAGGLFGKNSLSYSVAPTLSWTIFDGLARNYRVAESKAQMEEAVDNYNLTVATAVEETRNAIGVYQASVRQMNLERETADESGEAVALALDRYRQGLTGFTPVADAQLTWLEYRNALLTSQSKALVALVNLYQAPDGGRSDFQYTLVAQGRLEDASQFGDIILRQDAGRILRLKDVAKVELGSQSYGAVAKVNGQPTALVGVQQLPGANALDVAKVAEKELERLSRYFPDGVHYRIVQNVSDYVRESIDDVFVTFVLTTLILMLVILIFLQNWRAVIIPMLTIPVSIIATFAVMKLMGFSLNTLTLSRLVLAIAIVVDDAIVVVEDCSRLVDKGELDRKQAAAKAMKELTGPVIGEVLVLMSVFIPTAFVSGITGELYKQFALTIAYPRHSRVSTP